MNETLSETAFEVLVSNGTAKVGTFSEPPKFFEVFFTFLPSTRIFVPTADLQGRLRKGTEGVDIGRCQPGVRNEGDVEVHGGTPQMISVPQLGM